MNEMGAAPSTYGGEEKRGAYRVLVGKPEGKRPLGRPICRWENKNKVGFRKWDWMNILLDTKIYYPYFN
jgi:hypothetical protein